MGGGGGENCMCREEALVGRLWHLFDDWVSCVASVGETFLRTLLFGKIEF